MLDTSALFNMSYGLYVLSAKDKAGKLYGCIINAAIQTSGQPPSLAVSTNVKNLTTAAILESGKFALSILSQEADMMTIGRFGFRTSADFDKFSGIPVIYTSSGLPVLNIFTCAYLECDVAGSADAHTHKVIFGDIREAVKIASSAPPMTYDYYHKVIKGKTPKNAVSYVTES